MRKFFITLVLLLLVVSGIVSQPVDNVKFYEKYGLNEKQIEEIIKIKQETNRKIQEAKIELKIQKALLEKLLFADKVNMNKVEKLLKESLEWKLQIELSEITSRVKIREIMGADNWKKMMRDLKRRKEKNKEKRQREKKPKDKD